MLTETDKAYLAGFFDGDGCVFIAKMKLAGRPNPAYCLHAQYAQKERSILERWQAKVGMGKIYDRKYGGHEWVMTGQNAETFLALVLPYLDLKRAEAEIGLKFRKTQHGKSSRHIVPAPVIELREQYHQMIKVAKHNRGGDVEWSPEIQEYENLMDSQIELPGF